MNKRLLEIIRYKTGGKQTVFAELMGWSPQYLAKLLKGDNFGLQPVLSVLDAFPEINARWFLFGQGSMLEIGRLFELQRQTMTYIQSLIDINRFIPVMTADEIRIFEEAVKTGQNPVFAPDTLSDLSKRLTDRTNELNAKFAQATAKSDVLCKHQTVRK